MSERQRQVAIALLALAVASAPPSSCSTRGTCRTPSTVRSTEASRACTRSACRRSLNVHAAEFAANIALFVPLGLLGALLAPPPTVVGRARGAGRAVDRHRDRAGDRAPLPALVGARTCSATRSARPSGSACRWCSASSRTPSASRAMTAGRARRITIALFVVYLVGLVARDPVAAARDRRRVRPGAHGARLAQFPRHRADLLARPSSPRTSCSSCPSASWSGC